MDIASVCAGSDKGQATMKWKCPYEWGLGMGSPPTRARDKDIQVHKWGRCLKQWQPDSLRPLKKQWEWFPELAAGRSIYARDFHYGHHVPGLHGPPLRCHRRPCEEGRKTWQTLGMEQEQLKLLIGAGTSCSSPQLPGDWPLNLQGMVLCSCRGF